MTLPRRVFLDTNVICFILDHTESILENDKPPRHLPSRDIQDIEALSLIFQTGQRAYWELAVSPLTYQEIMATSDPNRRRTLEQWFDEILIYWRDCCDEDGSFSDSYASKIENILRESKMLSAFPDMNDRSLISHAIAYECDAFCTRDHRTILKRAHQASTLPIQIISPTDWANLIQPYAALF